MIENSPTITDCDNLTVIGALAEFERDLIWERTNSGLKAARALGRLGGRPPKLTSKQIEMAQRLLNDSEVSVAEVCRTLQVSRLTLYRYYPQTKSVETPKSLRK